MGVRATSIGFISGTMIQQLNRLFPYTEWVGLKRLASIRNQVYAAKATTGETVLFKCAPADNCQALEREYETISQFHKRGAPVPRPIPMRETADRNQLIINGTTYTVRGYEYIRGQPFTPTARHFYAFGAAIGQLHEAWNATKRPNTIPIVTADDLIAEPLTRITNQCSDLGRLAIVQRMAAIVTDELESNQEQDLLGIAHGDAHHLNALRDHEGSIILFDLEDISWQWRAYDLATAIWGSFSNGGSATAWDRLIAGYSSIRSLSQREAGLIRYLIFARHLWWLGLNARNWEQWKRPQTREEFFESGLDLLIIIGRDVCGLNENTP